MEIIEKFEADVETSIVTPEQLCNFNCMWLHGNIFLNKLQLGYKNSGPDVKGLGLKEDFGYLHFDLKLSSWIFLSSLPLRLGVRPLGQNPLKGTKTTPLKQQGLPWVSKTPPLIDSQTVISLPFLAYLHTSTRLRHTFSLYKPGSGLGILETVFAMLVCYVTGVGLTEINSFYFHHPLFSFF